jgi:glycine/D-amino acid oxidase-like deaminating enzyme
MKYSFWWDTGYDEYKQIQSKLDTDITCNWLVVGGGLSGLHAALTLVEQNQTDIVLIESFECGRGTTGASTGFVMPDAETSLSDLVSHFGKKSGEYLWNFVQEGCDLIYNTSQDNKLNTDIEKQDTYYIALAGKEKDIQEEYNSLQAAKKTSTIFTQPELQTKLGSDHIMSAVSYPNTYAMNPLVYAHELKLWLIKKGVTIYEYTTASEILNTYATANEHTIKFTKSIVTINKPRRETSLLSNKISGVQSSACVSRMLTKDELTKVFPDAAKKMVYDSRDFYLYWRLTSDNRIILGQDSLLTLLSPNASKNKLPVQQAIKQLYDLIPSLNGLEFEYYWSEIIDGTYDLIPLIYTSGNVTYSGGNVGLPWAARTGKETVLVALGLTSINFLLSKKRVPYSMLGQNKYIKLAQYAIAYELSQYIPNNQTN